MNRRGYRQVSPANAFFHATFAAALHEMPRPPSGPREGATGSSCDNRLAEVHDVRLPGRSRSGPASAFTDETRIEEWLMAYDEKLAFRIRTDLQVRSDVVEKQLTCPHRAATMRV